jgi:diguanylate cyclase (GGDEF)-like protein
MKGKIPMGDEEFQRLRKLYDYAVLDTEPEPNFDRLAWIASRVFKTPIATLSLADAQRHWFKARVGVEGREMPRRMSFCNETISDDQVFVVSDAQADARFAAAPVVTEAPWVRFYAGAPLIAPGGFRVGSLCVLDTRPRDDFAAHEADILRNLAGTAIELLEARSRQSELTRRTEEIALLARQDPLTGLANRRLFHERLTAAIADLRPRRQIAVFCLDLDRFKEVNDTLGHAAGDALLQQVSVRINAELRESDTVARLGGDEFAVLLADCRTRDQALRLAERLIAAVCGHYVLDGRRVEVAISIGFALSADCGEAAGAGDLLRNADTALYQAKAAGRHCWRLFDPATLAWPAGDQGGVLTA